MKLLIICFLFFFAVNCFGQQQDVYFLKNNGTYVDQKDSADYIMIVSGPNPSPGLYNITETYKNGRKRFTGKSLTKTPVRYEGVCFTFYPSGNKKNVATFRNGSMVGVDSEFYPNGKIYSVLEYPADGVTENSSRDNYLIRANYDSLGNVLMEKGRGHCKLYDADFEAVQEEGDVRDGKKTGNWKGYFKDSKASVTENYEDGLLITGLAVFDDGQRIDYGKTRRQYPQFKGGVTAFGAYLSNNIRYPAHERKANKQGTVIIAFIVAKDGTITDVKVAKSVSEEIDNEALRVIKKSPLWVPGTIFGRPVRVQYSVPITFILN